MLIETKKNRKHIPLWKKILFSFIALILLLFIGGWIFLNYFADGFINSKGIPKVREAVLMATHGRFSLSLGRISYSHGTVLLKNIEFARVRFDSVENGTTIKTIAIDTITISGVSWWDILWGNPLTMKSIEANSPRIYLMDASKEAFSQDVIGDSLRRHPSKPFTMPPISFDSVAIRNISVFMPSTLPHTNEPSFKNISILLGDFAINSKDTAKPPFLFSKRVNFSVPYIDHATADSFYTVRLRNLHGSISDSLMTLDSFSYQPNYSDDVYASKHKYIQGALDFRTTKIRIEGVDFAELSSGNRINIEKLEAGGWSIDSYVDRRKTADPHPADAAMPNDLIRSLPIILKIDSLVLNNGKIKVRERAKGSLQPGVLFFDRSRISMARINTDSLSPKYGEPTNISISAYFVGEGFLQVAASYPLTHKTFDLSIHATIGKFTVKKLNSWLIPFERMEVSDGIVDRGNIDMNIRSGVSTTTVTPQYHDFSMKILAADPKEGRGIMEGLKTFFANTFVLKSNNIAEKDKPAKSATSTLKRQKDQEFMQFIWISLRKALGGVVGGFK